MHCYLVRHAQTVWNGENRLQGHTDLPLSPLGFAQAQRVGRYFAGLAQATAVPRALYVSHLSRSLQTAEAIVQHTGMSLIVEPALAEMHLGQWEGRTPEEIDAQFTGDYARWRVAPSQVTIPDAEPVAQFRARVRDAFGRIAAAHADDETVVIVTHGGVIASLLAECLEADYDRLLQRVVLGNAGISAVDCRTQPPHVLWINATAHLQEGQLAPHDAEARVIPRPDASPKAISRPNGPDVPLRGTASGRGIIP